MTGITYGSVCSGIKAASVAWASLGWRCSFLSEIEAFPRAVIEHRFPGVTLHGDFTTIRAGDHEPIDLLVGGTPCQSFSVAGLRGGMADERGNLALEYLRLADRLRPRWLVWENVPGVLSAISHTAPDICPPPPPMDLECDGAEVETEDEYCSEELHAFNCFLAGLSELGYGFAYRVLDAQYFGLAQRRKRVFVVGYLGDWRRAAAVLFEPASLRGHPSPRRATREGIAPTLSARPTGGGGLGTDFDLDGGLIAAIQERAVSENANAGPDGVGVRTDGLAYTLEARSVPQAVAFDCKAGGKTGFAIGERATALRGEGHGGGHVGVMTLAIRGRGENHDLEWRADGTANALLTPNGGRGGIGVGAVCFDAQQITSAQNRSRRDADGPASTIAARSQMHAAYASTVRRLTPRECERLQGFPDDWTMIPYRGKPAADGPRYKALGNSMAVPVMRWIGERIAKQEAAA